LLKFQGSQVNGRHFDCQIAAHSLVLTNFDSVRKFAKTFLEAEENLDVMVNNSGDENVFLF